MCILCNVCCTRCNVVLGNLASFPTRWSNQNRPTHIHLYKSPFFHNIINIVITWSRSHHHPGGRSRILWIWAARFHRQMAKPNWTTHTQNTIYIHTYILLFKPLQHLHHHHLVRDMYLAGRGVSPSDGQTNNAYQLNNNYDRWSNLMGRRISAPV